MSDLDALQAMVKRAGYPVGVLKASRSWCATDTNDVFGDGRDGDVVITEPMTLTRDMYYRTLKDPDGKLNPNGYSVFVAGKGDEKMMVKIDASKLFPNPNPSCSFCGKKRIEVKVLVSGRISGKTLPCICDECIPLCASILADWKRDAAMKSLTAKSDGQAKAKPKAKRKRKRKAK